MIEGIQSFLLWVGVITAFIISIRLSLKDQWRTSTVMAALSIAFLVFANFDKIQELKIGKDGIALLQRAENTLEELQSISEPFAIASLQTMQGAGRWGGLSEDEKEQHKNEIVEGLLDIGFSKARVNQVLDKSWHKYKYLDLSREAIGNPQKYPAKFREEAFSLYKRHIGNSPSPEEITELLKKAGVYEKQEAALSRYKAYIQNSKL